MVNATLTTSAANELLDWRNFYRQVFGLEIDLSSIELPEPREGFNRLIVVAQGLTIEQVYQKCAELFPCEKCTSLTLDEFVPLNDRTPDNGTYAVWNRGRAEADEEHSNRSSRDLGIAKTSCITVLERLLLEVKYYNEVGGHLDTETITLCAGSNSPYIIFWDGDKLMFDWLLNSNIADSTLRAREVVALPKAV